MTAGTDTMTLHAAEPGTDLLVPGRVHRYDRYEQGRFPRWSIP